MDTRTGEIITEEEMHRRIGSKPPAHQAVERSHFVPLSADEADLLRRLTPAERLAFNVRRKVNPAAAALMLGALPVEASEASAPASRALQTNTEKET